MIRPKESDYLSHVAYTRELEKYCDWLTNSETEELKAKLLFEKKRRVKLLANPNCSDPDHPGCKNCIEENESSN